MVAVLLWSTDASRAKQRLRVKSAKPLSGCHYDDDRFWDGDLTLWELEVLDGDACAEQLVAVPRGNAFISAEKVAGYVETRFPLTERPIG